MAEKNCDTEKCLLSEFDRPGFRWIYHFKYPGIGMGLICFFWAVLTVVVGDRARANGIALTVTATLTSVPDVAGKWRQTFGYLGETNFGFYFLVVAPLLTYLAFHFLLCAGRSLSEFKVRGVLCSCAENGVSESPIQSIAKRNRRLFPLLFSPFILIPICLYSQFSSLSNVSQGYPTKKGEWELGHVQSPYLPLWINYFNNSNLNEAERFAILKRGNHTDDVANAVLARIVFKGKSTIKATESLLKFDKGPENSPTAFKLEEAITKGVVKMSAVATGNADRASVTQMRWFRLFVVMSQVQVGMLFAFELWILFKICFWLHLLYTLLPRPNGTQRFQLKPLLTDPTKRFGLGGLFRPYNLIVFIIALGALYFALQLNEQTGFGAITTDPDTGSLVTRIFNLIVVLTVTCAVVVGPMLGFKWIMKHWTNARVGALNKEFARSNTKRQEEIESEIEKLKAQTTWPKGDPWFLGAMSAIIAMLVIPFGSQLAALPESITKYISIPAKIKKETRNAVRHYYKLTDEQEDKP